MLLPLVVKNSLHLDTVASGSCLNSVKTESNVLISCCSSGVTFGEAGAHAVTKEIINKSRNICFMN